MAGIPNSIVKFNAREQLLSSDLNRAQILASRDAQNLEGDRAGSFDSAAATPGSPSDLLSVNGTPISGVDKAPTFVFLSGYQVTIGPGRGFVYNPSLVGLTTDDSSYLVTRWDAAAVTFANPHATLARIDLVVATPGAVDADLQSRQTLVDPVTRAIAPANVFKTTNPVATLSVVTGTAGATPATPAVPAGALTLFYVWVPPSAATAATFGAARAGWRRAPYPLSAMTGVISGMGILWDQTTDPSTTSVPYAAKGDHRIVIDGEVMEFYSHFDSTRGNTDVDTAANPFGSAAGASWHQPYYFYAVGGRHNPMPGFNSSDGFLSPVTIVESLTPPDVNTNKPSANLTVRGVTVTPNGAVYLGLGFVYVNTVHRHACFMDAEMTCVVPGTANALSHTWAGTGTEAIGVIGSMPSISTKIRVFANFAASVGILASVSPDRGDGGGAAIKQNGSEAQLPVLITAATGHDGAAAGVINTFAGNGKLWGANDNAGTVGLFPLAFDHRVGRIGSQVNP